MINPYETWQKYHVDDLQAFGIHDLYEKDGRPQSGGFDTETTGLHIIKDKPFLLQFGWLIKGERFGRVFTCYPTQKNMKLFFRIAKKWAFCLAWNLKFDIHMLSNIGYASEVQAMTNLCDGMALARLSGESIPERNGGDSMKLKLQGEKYVHHGAAKSESLIKENLEKLNNARIAVLSAALKQFDHPTEATFKPVRKDTGKPTTAPYAHKNPDNVEWKEVPKKWGKGLVEKFLKDPTNEVEDLPDDIRDVWIDWNEEYPEPTYEDVDREIMIEYGGDDIITMLEHFKKSYPIVKNRGQLDILQLERDCILPMYRMERVGVKADLKYLEESRQRVKKEIRKLRFEMRGIAKEFVTVNQHERLQQLFMELWNISMESCDKPNLKRLMKPENPVPEEAKRFASLITQLRSLEKWYSTYIKRVIKNAEYDGNVYTQINSYGAVSGRMSCDFQQFPKKALMDEKGNELFHPRKAFIVKGNGYEEIAYIDYDQIELVTQAHYTLLVSGGDPNLCRAYMPFKCHHYLTGEIFDYTTDDGRARWNEKQAAGEISVWLDEEDRPWVKTDVHSQTTHRAFPTIPLGTEEFAEWRGKGKMFNFMANYGGGKHAAMDSLDLEEAEADALVRGYNEAFPHVIIYQKTIQTAHRQQGYIANHYGRRYYLTNTRISYKLANYNVQGTCADALKRAIIELDKFLLDKKTNMVLPVHDEIQFDLHHTERHLVSELRKIMQDAFDWCLLPVTAGVELTKTSWSEKENVA